MLHQMFQILNVRTGRGRDLLKQCQLKLYGAVDMIVDLKKSRTYGALRLPIENYILVAHHRQSWMEDIPHTLFRHL